MAKIERKIVDKSSLKEIPIVWVIGGPGSGKGTQCEHIERNLNFIHLSSGDILRQEVMSGSNRGIQLYKLMSDGELVPNAIIDDLLAEAMVAKANSGAKGFLLDGFPISVDQADLFESEVGPAKLILVLEAGDEVLRGRLKARGNFDDTDDAIVKRIATFNNTTRPILEKYGSKVKRVNAESPKDTVYAEVSKILSAL